MNRAEALAKYKELADEWWRQRAPIIKAQQNIDRMKARANDDRNSRNAS
ncbi:hypothetical protein [Enterococcus sp. 2201sp1_2201st1_B8_2201SCRN_220225]